MTQTGYLLPDWKMPHIAKGYGHGVLPVDNGLIRYRQAGEVSWVLKGNGGVLSTLADFYIWLNALENNLILPEDLMTKLTEPYVKEDFLGSSHYAYGWSIKEAHNTKLVTHNGSNAIFFAEVRWLPTEQVQIILLSNMLTGQIFSLASEVDKILYDPSHTPEKFDLPKKAKIAKFAQSFSGNEAQFVSQLSSRFKSVKKDSDVLRKLGSESVFLGELELATKLLEANVSLHKKDGKTWNTLGRAYYKQDNFEAAKQAFEKALKLKGWWSCSWCKDSQNYLDLIKGKGF